MRKMKIMIFYGLIAVGLLAVTNFALADGEWAIISGTSNINNTNAGNVGIGTTSPGAKLTVNKNAATLQPPTAGTVMQIGQADGSGNVLLLDTYGAGSVFVGRRAQGTAALPSAISGSGIKLTSLAGYGYGATGYSSDSRAEVRLLSEQAWTDVAQGTRISFFTTLNGTTTPLERLTIKHGGNIGIGTTSPAKKLTVAGQIQVAGSSDYNRIEVIGTSPDYNNNGFRLEDQGNFINMALDNTGGFMINQWLGSAWQNRFYIGNNGNIGIGTITPSANLEIMANAESNEQLLFLKNFAGTRYYLGVTNVANAQRFLIGGNGGNALSIDPSSNVGIGTINPQSKLAVNGTITTKKIKVTETGWSDFVFDEGYKLPTLAAVESHIKQYKHLPGIPSAKEIEKKGLDVSDVLAKQMQKIEELTLYVIELQKQIEELKKK